MPPKVQQSNAKHYKSDTVTEVKEFEGFAHLLPAQEGWEEVADYALDWALEHAGASERSVSELKLTHIGGPTVLIEVGGWRLLTDPTFDPPGGSYRFGWGTGSKKTAGPAIAPEDLGPIDAVLLSHDHHDDNLDKAGREFLGRPEPSITTVAGAKRLGGKARGLADWETTKLEGDARARHRDHGNAVPPRPATQQADRRRCDRLRAAAWTARGRA